MLSSISLEEEIEYLIGGWYEWYLNGENDPQEIGKHIRNHLWKSIEYWVEGQYQQYISWWKDLWC